MAESTDDVRLLADAKKLPMADRVGHASWKVRSAAYEDMAKACSQVWDEADPCLQEYGERLEGWAPAPCHRLRSSATSTMMTLLHGAWAV